MMKKTLLGTIKMMTRPTSYFARSIRTFTIPGNKCFTAMADALTAFCFSTTGFA